MQLNFKTPDIRCNIVNPPIVVEAYPQKQSINRCRNIQKCFQVAMVIENSNIYIYSIIYVLLSLTDITVTYHSLQCRIDVELE